MIHVPILILFDPKPSVDILLLRSYNIQYHSTEYIQSVTNKNIFRAKLAWLIRWRIYRTLYCTLDSGFESDQWYMFKFIDRKGLGTMLTINRSAGILEVNSRSILHAGNEACKWGIHLDFETQGICHQKFKRRISVTPKEGLISPQN